MSASRWTAEIHRRVADTKRRVGPVALGEPLDCLSWEAAYRSGWICFTTGWPTDAVTVSAVFKGGRVTLVCRDGQTVLARQSCQLNRLRWSVLAERALVRITAERVQVMADEFSRLPPKGEHARDSGTCAP